MLLEKIFSRYNNILNIILIVIVSIYYFQFVGKGLVLNDPGYYLYNAERVLNGATLYKDVFIQFPPGYFYILAFSFKLFGVQVLTGRYLTLALCLGIVFISLKILESLNIYSPGIKILSVLSIAAFGFPLINNPALLAWVSVLTSLLIVYTYIKAYYSNFSHFWLFCLGLSLSAIFLLKQNLALYFFITTNLLLFFTLKESVMERFKKLIRVDILVFLITLSWAAYFFLPSNIQTFLDLIQYSSRYLEIFPFTYPPPSLLLTPFGFFKLVPYYLPIAFLFFVLKSFISKTQNWPKIFFAAFTLVGFAGTVYPTSDLLHVYPFLGVMLVSILAFFYGTKKYYIWVALVFLTILIGFYLSLFREYYRYYSPYKYQNTSLELPKSRGIEVEQNFVKSSTLVHQFLEKNTRQNETVLMYPFCETLYFIFNRESPSKFTIYYPEHRTEHEEKQIIENLNRHKTKYIVTCGEYKFDTILSKYVQNQNKILEHGILRVFSTKHAL